MQDLEEQRSASLDQDSPVERGSDDSMQSRASRDPRFAAALRRRMEARRRAAETTPDAAREPASAPGDELLTPDFDAPPQAAAAPTPDAEPAPAELQAQPSAPAETTSAEAPAPPSLADLKEEGAQAAALAHQDSEVAGKKSEAGAAAPPNPAAAEHGVETLKASAQAMNAVAEGTRAEEQQKAAGPAADTKSNAPTAQPAPHKAEAAPAAADKTPAAATTTAAATAGTQPKEGQFGVRDLGAQKAMAWSRYKKTAAWDTDIARPDTGEVVSGQGWDNKRSKEMVSDGTVFGDTMESVQAVEGGLDSVQTYDNGILSFGIMQWTLHAGSLQGFLEYLKTSGPDGKAAFDEIFGAFGIDVKGGVLYYGGKPYPVDAHLTADQTKGLSKADRKKLQKDEDTKLRIAMSKLVRPTADVSKKWAEQFAKAGADPRVQQAEIIYSKKEFNRAMGARLDPTQAKKKGEPAPAPRYRTPGFWVGGSSKASALYFSMFTNSPGMSYTGVRRAADQFMKARGEDPTKWDKGWPEEYATILEAVFRAEYGDWGKKGGRVDKTLDHLSSARGGRMNPNAKPSSSTASTAGSHAKQHGDAHPAQPTSHPAAAAHPVAAPHAAEVAHPAQPAAPAHDDPKVESYVAKLEHKIESGVLDAKAAVSSFLQWFGSSHPQKTAEVQKRLEQAAPKPAAHGGNTGAASPTTTAHPTGHSTAAHPTAATTTATHPAPTPTASTTPSTGAAPEAAPQVHGSTASLGDLQALVASLNNAQASALAQQMADLVALSQQLGKSLNESNREEHGEGRRKLVSDIGAARARIAALDGAGLPPDKLATVKTGFYRIIQDIAPYHSQYRNVDILESSTGTQKRLEKSGEKTRTCNITSLAMALEALGKSVADYDSSKQAQVLAAAKYFNPELSKAEMALGGTGANWNAMLGLRLPDFMELAVIAECLSGKDDSDAAVLAAAQKGWSWILMFDNLRSLAKRFGVKGEFRYFSVDASANATAPSAKHKNKEYDALAGYGAQHRKEMDDLYKARHAAEVDPGSHKLKDAYEAKLAAAQGTLDGKGKINEALPIETYKHAIISQVAPELDAGYAIETHVHNHFVRLQAVHDDYVIIDDPASEAKAHRKVPWAEARGLGLLDKRLLLR